MKVHRIESPSFFEFHFFCPGCKQGHGFRTVSHPAPNDLNDDEKELFKNKWTWNNDFDRPTIMPSLNVLRKIGTDGRGKAIYETTCHSHVKDGMIQFLGDCKHDMKNTTVEIPEF